MTSPRIERRLAAILAADVAGYSRLMGVDEVGTLSALKEHRRERIDPAIARHNGRIVRTTGDRLLVEFASVVDAVACAVAIQRLARTHGGQVLRRMRCFGACGGRVGAAWLVTAPILNTRVRPRPVRCVAARASHRDCGHHRVLLARGWLGRAALGDGEQHVELLVRELGHVDAHAGG